jgi:phosphoglycerate kinase
MQGMPKLSIRDLDLVGKRVLIRVDFNVPLSKDEVPRILDDTRIRETIPTIEYALRRKAKVILCSHLGRPKGKVVAAMSLRPVVDRLRELLRFHAEEEANDPAFAKQLAGLCELYVNDAFGSAHRAHASTEGITHFVAQSAAGLLMESELKHLGKALNHPDKPFVAIIGGAKVSDKITVIESLMAKADAILIGGGMAYTFLRAQGQHTGKSLVEEDKIDVAKAALEEAHKRGIKFLLPVDHILADRFDPKANSTAFAGSGAFPEELMALDIGPQTEKLFAAEIAEAQTVLWNGPMGVFEFPAFAHGTNAIAKAVAANEDATTIVGGGDSVSAIHKSGFAGKITHISTGGGASLEFLEGKVLPGVEALTNK